LVPGLHPPGEIQSEDPPLTWWTESGAKHLEDRIVDSYAGPDVYIDLHNAFNQTVEQDQIGIVYENEQGEIDVEPVPDTNYNTENLWAPEP
jgi:hypothetical protein